MKEGLISAYDNPLPLTARGERSDESRSRSSISKVSTISIRVCDI